MRAARGYGRGRDRRRLRRDRRPAHCLGRAVLFFSAHDGAPAGAALSARVTLLGGQTTRSICSPGRDVQLAVEEAEPVLPGALAMAFVIDATGSMADERQYISAESPTSPPVSGPRIPICRFASR
jgi:hypothetical protein